MVEDSRHVRQTLGLMSLTKIGQSSAKGAFRARSVLTLPGGDVYEGARCRRRPRTWVGCKRNDLVSMSPGQLLREDDICLSNESEAGYLLMELTDRVITYKLALPVQPKPSLLPPSRPVLESVEFQPGTNKRRTEKMRPRRGIDHASLTSFLYTEEHGKEKFREVKVPYGEVQLWISGGSIRTYLGRWFRRRGRNRPPWDLPWEVA